MRGRPTTSAPRKRRGKVGGRQGAKKTSKIERAMQTQINRKNIIIENEETAEAGRTGKGRERVRDGARESQRERERGGGKVR